MTNRWHDAKPRYFPTGSHGNGARGLWHNGTSEADYYTPEEFEFLKAIDHYKREHDRPFPTWREVLDIVKSLGYRKEDKSERCNGQETPQRPEITQTYTLSALSRAG